MTVYGVFLSECLVEEQWMVLYDINIKCIYATLEGTFPVFELLIGFGVEAEEAGTGWVA